MPRVLDKKEMIDDAVKQTMHELEQRAPLHMHRLKQNDEKYRKILCAAREAATEEIQMAKEFAEQPSHIFERLKKYLPEDRIKMIQAGLSFPTYRLSIRKSGIGHHVVSLDREGVTILTPRKLLTKADIDWAKIMQYASIVVEGVLLVMSAVGISLSPSSDAIENAAEEVAQALKNSSEFEKAIQTFVDAWDSGLSFSAVLGSAYQKAKALFYLIKDIYATGLLWKIIKALCSNMAWYDWLEIAAKVTAMIIAALATDGAALIAKIAWVLLSAGNFARKFVNLSQLKAIKLSMS